MDGTKRGWINSKTWMDGIETWLDGPKTRSGRQSGLRRQRWTRTVGNRAASTKLEIDSMKSRTYFERTEFEGHEGRKHVRTEWAPGQQISYAGHAQWAHDTQRHRSLEWKPGWILDRIDAQVQGN